MSVTIKDVAKEAGLAISTISKYLNGGNVREDNRIKIVAAIEKLSYVMNSSARQLRSARTYMIGVLIGAAKSPYTANLLSEIEKCLQEQGYAVTFAGQNLSPERVLRFANYLLTQGVDGMIVWPVFAGLQSMELLRGENVPVVMLEENWEGSPFDCVQVECSKGTYDLVDHLIRNKHEKIAMITGPRGRTVADERLNGYMRAMEDYCLPVKKEAVIRADFSFESGYEGMKKLWGLKDRPTAVLAGNYDLAQGMMAAVAELKISVPEELSIVVFDDFELSQMVRPKLTAFQQPAIALADSACQLLLDQITNGIPAKRRVVRIPGEIQYRDSVRNLLESETAMPTPSSEIRR